MFRPVIWIVLFGCRHGYVHATWVFSCHLHADMIIRHAAVLQIAVCVTFGAPFFGANFGNIYARSEYVTFCTISATAVREMTVCVTFGAPNFGFRQRLGDSNPFNNLVVCRMGANFGIAGLNF